ncbi:MAG TPA: GreA/GreB family elongation factor [Chloroflexota bacterium]|nr:GreA/GreB family elongation factor [Chloroflexota bacterium]
MQYKQHKLTVEGKAKLEAELAEIRSVERPRLAESLRSWHEGGDVTDNAAFEQMKERLAALSDRMVEIETLLREAEIIDKNGHHANGTVEIGSSVTVSRDDGKTTTYDIVDSLEAAPHDGKISDASPIGSALVGRKIGDTVTVEVPSRVLKLTITSVT